MNHSSFAFWHLGEKELLEKLRSSSLGIGEKEAAKRLKRVGKNQLAAKKKAYSFIFVYFPV